jgi:Zn-dependent peptidase ImmA (M78 family)
MIQDFIKDICNLLDIPEPTLSYDTSSFSTETMMAQCDPENNIIFIRKKDRPDPDYLFAVAHETRHIWQYLKDEKLYFLNYKTSETCEDSEAYNLQIAEIDANAFAGLIMTDFFGLEPQYNGMSAIVKRKIHKRMEFLLNHEFAQ